jgi:hypothetical protein
MDEKLYVQKAEHTWSDFVSLLNHKSNLDFPEIYRDSENMTYGEFENKYHDRIHIMS